MDGGLDVLCGLSLDGARLTEVEDLAVGRALVGCGAFGPSGLLRDLELRLGLASVRASASRSVRIARWSARLKELAARGRFYSRSYEVDPWGTASELLRMRDTLVEAGWNGGTLDGCGERLSQLSEVEAQRATPLPPSTGDRLRAVAAALDAGARPGYVRLRTAEPIALWSRGDGLGDSVGNRGSAARVAGRRGRRHRRTDRDHSQRRGAATKAGAGDLPAGWDAVLETDIDGERAETTELENREPRYGAVNAARRIQEQGLGIAVFCTGR